ncbi:DHA2 family efflux MFS transporter permease subunit [Streptomyces capparidis]
MVNVNTAADPLIRPVRRRPVRPGVVLALVCSAQFMISLDIAIVNVALPSIQADLGLAPTDLQWVVITYGLLLGGLLLLGGRAADLLGRRRVLLTGMGVFTVSSLVAGLAGTFELLVAGRAGQGVGAALAAPAALAILVNTYPEGAERTKALGVLGAVGGSAASFGVVLSGVLTAGPGWAWIFFVNVPIGLALLVLVTGFVPADRPGDRGGARGRFDVLGAVAVTAGLMAVVYAINRSVDHGWTSAATIGFLVAGLVLLAAFVLVERSAAAPLMPLSMFRRPTLNAANAVAALVFGAFIATIFQASLFMQQVLGYSALRTGVAYLAIAMTSVVAAAGIAPRVLGRLGPGSALAIGQGSSAAGLLLLARAPEDAGYWPHLFPAMILIGVGVGLSMVAVQVAAFIGIPPSVSGLAGGMVETSREIGGALGTAIVASVAIAATDDLLATGTPAGAALTEGFQRGSLVAAGLNLAGVLLALVVLRRAERTRPAAAAPTG